MVSQATEKDTESQVYWSAICEVTRFRLSFESCVVGVGRCGHPGVVVHRHPNSEAAKAAVNLFAAVTTKSLWRPVLQPSYSIGSCRFAAACSTFCKIRQHAGSRLKDSRGQIAGPCY